MNIIRTSTILLCLNLCFSLSPVSSQQISDQLCGKNPTKKDLLKIEDLMVKFELVCRKSGVRSANMFEKAPIAFQIRDVLYRLRKDKSCYEQISHVMASVWSTDRLFDYAFFVLSYDLCEFNKSEWYAINDRSVEVCKQESRIIL